MGIGEQQTVERWNINLLAKVISAIALLIPIQYGLIYYMVEAAEHGTDSRLTSLERQAAKGERFTAEDGKRLHDRLNTCYDTVNAIREIDAKLSENVVKMQVQQTNTAFRIKRLEDQIYQHLHENRQHSTRMSSYGR